MMRVTVDLEEDLIFIDRDESEEALTVKDSSKAFLEAAKKLLESVSIGEDWTMFVEKQGKFETRKVST